MTPLELLIYALCIIALISKINKLITEEHNQIVFDKLYRIITQCSDWIIKQELFKSPFDKHRPLSDKVNNYIMALIAYLVAFGLFLSFASFSILWVDALYSKTENLELTMLGGIMIFFFILLIRIYKVLGDKHLYKARHNAIK